MPSLQTLNLAFNKLFSLRSVCQHVTPSLLRLNVADNSITYFPVSFNFSALLDLDLSGNHFEGVVQVPSLPSLRTLSFARNRITKLTGLGALTKLDSLDVSGNGIADVNDLCGMRLCGDLGKVALHDNPMAHCPRYRYAVYAIICLHVKP